MCAPTAIAVIHSIYTSPPGVMTTVSVTGQQPFSCISCVCAILIQVMGTQVYITNIMSVHTAVQKYQILLNIIYFNPYNAEATFFLSIRMQRSLKTIETLSCWYSLDSSYCILSDEYPCTSVPAITQVFCIIL